MASSSQDLEQDGGDDDGAFDDLLREGRDTEQIEDIREHGDDGGAQQGAADIALAAEEAGAADDGDGDGFELEADTGDRLTDGEP